jgi:serine/threonine protein kinase/Flp pilus assembly protein TadD
MSETLTINSTISHYRIISKLGAGGMGEVYLAEDTRLDRKVALKLLPAEFTQDEDRVRRFIQEAKAASALNHPNIITIYEIGEIDGTHFIATEFIDGQTLRQQMTSGEMTLHAALDIAIQTASALTAAHEAGIVHRDIKPENIMVRRDGIIKVLDFGLAKLTEQQSAEVNVDAPTAAKVQTDPGAVMGTASYMSPEQARGQKVDARTDLFSLGVVLYEMIAGRSPFGGVNALEVIGEILKSEPQPLKSHAAEVPSELQRIVSKLLRKNRDERYQSARDLLNDLKDLKEELSFAAKQARAGQTEKNEAVTASADAVLTAAGAGAPTTSSAKIILGEMKRHKFSATLMLMLLLIVAATLSYFSFFARPKAGPIDSLAVLPFQNRSASADSEYLSDGLAESLIYRLSQLPNLKVSPTSSVFRYKDKDADPQIVGNELGVRAVMTGRLAQRGENLTISVELVDVRNNKTLWGEQYERKMSDLLATQREIATAIAEKLQLKLSGEDAKGLTKKYTESNEAYQLYLKGRFQWNKRTGDALKQAAEFYQQAIEQAPGFALAYSWLAETYVLFSNYDVASSLDSMPQAKAAAMRALELDESLAEAHTALGRYFMVFEFNWAGAEKELRRAIELNPNYATAHQWLGEYLVYMKRFDEGLAEIKRAQELDPLSPIIAMNGGWLNFLARRYDESIAASNRALSLHPNFGLAYSPLCWAYNAKGMKETIAACRKAREMHKDAYNTGYLAFVLGCAGQRDEARKLLDELKAESARRYVPSFAIAIAHLGLNEKEEVLVFLEREIAERGTWVTIYATAPELDDLRSDPRFKAMLKRLNLPE